MGGMYVKRIVVSYCEKGNIYISSQIKDEAECVAKEKVTTSARGSINID